MIAVMGGVAAIPWVMFASRALFLAGLIAGSALHAQAANLVRKVASTKIEIQMVNKAIDDLSTIIGFL